MYFVNTKPIKIDINDLLEHLIDLYSKQNYDTLYKIMKIEECYNKVKNKEQPYRYRNHIMTFYDDKEPIITVRIYVDEDTISYLNILYMITSNVMYEKDMINLILSTWLKKVGVIGRLKEKDEMKFIGEKTYAQISVNKSLWDEFTTSCKNKLLILKIGFKMAVVNYLNTLNSIENDIYLNQQDQFNPLIYRSTK